MGFGSKVGFCPYTWPYPPFLAIAPWPFLRLGCWTAIIAATLDTQRSIPNFGEIGQKLCDCGPARRLLLEPKERRESGEPRSWRIAFRVIPWAELGGRSTFR